MVYKWYILPIGGLYATYHLLGEPETTIDVDLKIENSPKNTGMERKEKNIGPFFQLDDEAQSLIFMNKKKGGLFLTISRVRLRVPGSDVTGRSHCCELTLARRSTSTMTLNIDM